MLNKKIMVTKPSLPPIDEFIKEVKDIWDNEWLTNMGPKHNHFISLLHDFLRTQNISLFVNGHLALEIVLQALNLSGEIITTPFTFVSTTNSIVRAGCKPVFCDIKDDYTIDEEKIVQLINKNTVAIMPVHVYGNICNYKAIENIAKQYNLKIIYDAAHAFGEEIDGLPVGNLGDASMFSFHATKVFNTIEGGGLVASNEVLEKCNNLRNFGIDNDDVEFIGTNAKMNEFQSAMGICSLNHYNNWVEKRKQIVELYDKIFYNVKGITINKRQDNIKYNYSYYPVMFNKDLFGKNREEIIEKLNMHNIFPRRYFYPLISDMRAYKDYDSGKTPIARNAADNIMTLPLYVDLDLIDVERIGKLILEK